MTVTLSQVTIHGRVISAELTYSDQQHFRLQLTVPFPIPKTNVQGDCFAPISLLIAMYLGEDLVLDIPVSASLYRHLKQACQLMASWPETSSWTKLHDIHIRALQTPRDLRKSKRKLATASLCTLGLDSFYTLVKYPHLDALIYIRGYDIPLENTSLLNQVEHNLHEVAGLTHKKVWIINSNFRILTHALGISWDMAHGPALAGVAHALSSRLDHFIINSSDSYLSHAPYGTHPQLDPLWSSNRVKIRSFGYPHKRSEKTRAIANNALAQKYLRVCWENPDDAYNCSRCLKCTRTMLQLESLQALRHFATFTPPIRVDAIRSTVEPRHRLFLWQDLMCTLPMNYLWIRWEILRLLIRSYISLL